MKCFSTNLATSFPPWPSNTPNTWTPVYSLILTMCESSMPILHPCMDDAAHLMFLYSPLMVFFSVFG